MPDFDKQTAPPDDAQKVAQWRLAAPQRAGSFINGFESMPNEPEKVQKVLTFAQIPLLAGETRNALTTGLEQRWHDVTADSNSLVTNSRNGGMKLDLSMFFEMPEADRQQYAPGLNSTFAPLLDYYQTWKRVRERTTRAALRHQTQGQFQALTCERGQHLVEHGFLQPSLHT